MMGLDLVGREAIRDVILRLSGQGHTILPSSHDLTDVEVLAQDLIVLNNGRMSFAGLISKFGSGSTMTFTYYDWPRWESGLWLRFWLGCATGDRLRRPREPDDADDDHDDPDEGDGDPAD